MANQFNLSEARKHYSDDEIQQYLLSQPGTEDARKAGYSDSEILNHFGFVPVPVAPAPASTSVSAAPEQDRSLLGYAGMFGQQALRGLIHGLGTPGDLLPRRTDSDTTADLAAAGGTFPTTNELLDAIRPTGLLNNTTLIPGQGPYPETEKLISAGIQGGASAMPFSFLGPGSVPARVALNVGTGAAGGVAGEAAHEFLPDNALAPMVAGGAVGLGIQGLASSIGRALTSRSLTRAVAEAENGLSDSQLALHSARQANADAAQAARDSQALQIADSTQQFTGVKSQLKTELDSVVAAHNANADAALTTANNAIEGIASAHGESKTLQDAGTTLQSAARDWRTKIMPAKLEEIWSPINSALEGAPTELGGFRGALSQISKSAGELEPLAELMKPGLPKQLQSRLDSLIDLKKTASGKSLEAPSPFSWEDTQKLRTSIGDAMSNPRMINDIGQQNLSHLYAAITSDMRQAVGKNSPTMLDAFDSANSASTGLYQLAEGPMSKIISGPKPDLANDPKPEQVASLLLSGGAKGGSDLAAIRAEIPQAVDELAAAHLRLGSWSKLAPEAKEALVPNPDHREALDAATEMTTLAPAARDSAIADSQQHYRDELARHADLVRTDKQDLQSTTRSTLANISADNRAKADEVFQARRRLDEAKNALNASGGPNHPVAESTYHALGAIMGGDLLGNLSTMLGYHLGVSELASHAAGATVGLMAPSIYRGAKSLVMHPETLPVPALGALGGSNALVPQTPPQQ